MSFNAGDKVKLVDSHEIDPLGAALFGTPEIGSIGVVTSAVTEEEIENGAPEDAFYVQFPAEEDGWIGGEFGVTPDEIELVTE